MILNILFLSKIYYYPCSNSNSCNNIEVNLERGIYKFECWGAQGGMGALNGVLTYSGGNGAYVSGYIRIEKLTKFYLFIGGKGGNGSGTRGTSALGGWNGGGRGGIDSRDNDGSGGGGGATDIRLLNGTWNNITSLRSRIMVAAGGSGSCYNTYGAPGGTLTGYEKINTGLKDISSSIKTTQINGNQFGIGGNGNTHQFTPSSGGGGGYYGGFSHLGSENPVIAVSDSGSSYISGHLLCNSINQLGFHVNHSYHFSNLYFYNTTMLNGIQYQPNFLNNNNILGNSGNGVIKITFIEKVFTPMIFKTYFFISKFIFQLILI